MTHKCQRFDALHLQLPLRRECPRNKDISQQYTDLHGLPSSRPKPHFSPTKLKQSQFTKWWQHLTESNNLGTRITPKVTNSDANIRHPQKTISSLSPAKLPIPPFFVRYHRKLAFKGHYSLSIFVSSDFLLPSAINRIVGLWMETHQSNAEVRDIPVDEVIDRVRRLILRKVDGGGLEKGVSSG